MQGAQSAVNFTMIRLLPEHAAITTTAFVAAVAVVPQDVETLEQ